MLKIFIFLLGVVSVNALANYNTTDQESLTQAVQKVNEANQIVSSATTPPSPCIDIHIVNSHSPTPQLPTALSIFNAKEAGKNKCSFQLYMNLISNLERTEKVQSRFEDQVWHSVENHVSVNDFIKNQSIPISAEHLNSLLTASEDCEHQCNTDSLNRVYESMISDLIVRSSTKTGTLHDKFQKLFHSIISSVEEKHNLELILNTYKTTYVNLPISKMPPPEKSKITNTQLTNKIKNETLAFYDFMEFFGFHYRKASMPYLKDRSFYQEPNIYGGAKHLTHVQDYCYTYFVGKERGNRIAIDPYTHPTNQRGISSSTVPVLVHNESDPPWYHSFQTNVFPANDPTQYITNAKQLGIPLVCGISGTTNILLWTLFDLGAELSANELRLYLLSAWATLCADGGHSLQEVLSAAKLVVTSIDEAAKKNPVASEVTRKLIPERTLSSLREITQDLSAIGPPETGSFGKYYDNFFKLIESDMPELKTLLDLARQNLKDHYKTNCVKPQNGLPSAPQVRKSVIL